MCLQHNRLWFGSSGEAHVRRACVSSTYSRLALHGIGVCGGRRRRERMVRRVLCCQSKSLSPECYTFFAASLGLSFSL